MNKKILIGIGVISLVGGIYYFMKKKKDVEAKSSEVAPSSETTEATTPIPPATLPKISTKPLVVATASKKEVKPLVVATASKKEVRKESKADKKTFKTDCGKRPILKKNRPAWQKCVDEQKNLAEGSSFEGTKSMDIFSDISGGFKDMDIL